MTTIAIQLVFGEKDGYQEKVEIDSGRPDLVFVWRTEDDQRMKKAKGDARKVLADKLGVLAYRFKDILDKPDMPGGVEYRYERYPKADKTVSHGS